MARSHGCTGTPEHKTWLGIHKRCYQTTAKTYPRYGGRGIVMCDTWRNSFTAFLRDMGPRPSPRHSIDRRDNNLGYSMGNCRWATPEEQAQNKRNNHNLEFRGETKPLGTWAKIVGLPRHCIRQRLLKLGWSVERALTTPRQCGDHSIRQMAVKHGLKRTTVSARLHKGWSIERALNTPV